MARSISRDAAEKQVREKCKAGDIIFVDAGFLIPRLCDLREPVVRCGSVPWRRSSQLLLPRAASQGVLS